MHALHPVQLDVAGRAGPADHGQRSGRLQSGQRLGDIGNDLVGEDDAEVVVRDQREDATTLPAEPSKINVPVSAIATAQLVITPSTPSSSETLS